MHAISLSPQNKEKKRKEKAKKKKKVRGKKNQPHAGPYKPPAPHQSSPPPTRSAYTAHAIPGVELHARRVLRQGRPVGIVVVRVRVGKGGGRRGRGEGAEEAELVGRGCGHDGSGWLESGGVDQTGLWRRLAWVFGESEICMCLCVCGLIS